MRIQQHIVYFLLLASIPLGVCLGQGAKSASPKTVKDAGSQAKLDWIVRIDKVHEIGCEDWITAAWAMMLIKQDIIPAKDASAVAGGILKMLETPDPKKEGFDYARFYQTHSWLLQELGKARAGNVKMARTQPSGMQAVFVRSLLMKRMCQIYDLQRAMLQLAEQHVTTIMPGYTHERHAQPTTFGHYILSGCDAIQRSAKTLEDGYHLMSLNEMGCGALAGTSWPIDRDLVTRYLGMEGLIENANDAVSYTDGYLVLVCGLANVCNVLSRMGLEMTYWSGVEYGFLEMGTHGKSFLMPQKSDNPTSLEHIRRFAGEVVGHLNSVAIAGLREPHGDVIGMLHLIDPTVAALQASEQPVTIMQKEMKTLKVHPERMLAVIRHSYIASTELANQMVRDYGLDYRTAHEIIHKFVLASEEQGISATEARVELLDAAAEEVLGKRLGMTEARLRELLDPAYFVKVTNSKGGVSPEEVARMIADRREKLDEARARHLKRIETLEKAQERLLADLRKLSRAVTNKTSKEEFATNFKSLRKEGLR